MEEHITGRTNPLLTHLRKLAGSGDYRRESGEFLCDSPKLLQEALLWKAPLRTVVADEEAEVPALPEGVRLVRISRELMASVSPLKTPQGILFTCRYAPAPLPEMLDGRHYVVLDGVQDPGNVGTVIRTADAFDADGVLLLSGCADPFSPKTLRSAMGALFRRPVWCCSAQEAASLLRRSKIPLYGAALRKDTLDARCADYTRAAVAIGSEGRGLSDEVLALCDATVKIPMSERCESLNAAVAAAVLLWEMYR